MLVRIFRHFVPVSVILLALIEITLIAIIWHWYLSTNPSFGIPSVNFLESPSLRLAIIAGLAMLISGLYQNKTFIDYRTLAAHLILGLVFLIPIAAFGYVYWDDSIRVHTYIWELYLKVAASWLVCIVITRAIFSTLTDLNLFKRRVIVLGAGKKAARIAEIEKSEDGGYFTPVAYLSTCPGSQEVSQKIIDVSNNDPDAISRLAREFKAGEVVIAPDDRRGLPVQQLLQCRMDGVGVIDYMDFVERETKTVDVLALYPGWLVFSDGFRGCGPAKLSKRCIDITLSVGLLLFTLPLMLLTSLLIKLDSPGPGLHRQERVGLGGKMFVVLKFRSMQADAEKDGTPLWAGARDPRVTRIGAVIRKLRIDELPQLLNVLYGEMSFVGPRPERPAFVDQFSRDIPFYSERHCVKPGITGWAQIKYPYGASLQDARNKLAYDLYYVKNYGIFLDLVIVLQTIRVVLSGSGAR